MSRPEFADANLRKAVNYAIDRQALETWEASEERNRPTKPCRR